MVTHGLLQQHRFRATRNAVPHTATLACLLFAAYFARTPSPQVNSAYWRFFCCLRGWRNRDGIRAIGGMLLPLLHCGDGGVLDIAVRVPHACRTTCHCQYLLYLLPTFVKTLVGRLTARHNATCHAAAEKRYGTMPGMARAAANAACANG